MTTSPGHAELRCRSNLSLVTGASHPAEPVEPVERVEAIGYLAKAIMDECSLPDVVRAQAAAREANLHLIIGSEMGLTRPGKV